MKLLSVHAFVRRRCSEVKETAQRAVLTRVPPAAQKQQQWDPMKDR